MRTVDTDTISDAVIATFAPTTPARLVEVLSSLTRHLHAFARETKLTHEEWRVGIDFLMKGGQITTEERNEFVLMSDVSGLSSLVDMLNSPKSGTPSSVLGPFHILGAPDLPVGGDLRGGIEGDPVIVSGIVTGDDGAPLEGAVIEMWQTAPNGLYSNQDPAMDPWALRLRMTTGADGRYAFVTLRPAPYTIPTDGPVGDLFRATGRHPWRPAHFHYIVIAKGYRTLVTEVFPEDDPYADEDAVFGVRRELCVSLKHQTTAAALPAGLLVDVAPPFYTVDFDIKLARS